MLEFSYNSINVGNTYEVKSMKIVDFEDIRDIVKEMNPSEWYNWVDDVLRHKSDYIMPPKSRISQDDGDYYNIMPALYEKENITAVKMIGRHSIKNCENRSIMMGDIMMYEANTGILLGVMDAEYITTMRTGVVAAYSALLFARDDFSVIGLIGLGNIMTICFMAFISKYQELGNKRLLTVKLLKHNTQEIRFAERFADIGIIRFEFCDTYEEVMFNSDIIFSAVTKATENFAEDKYYKEGVTIIPICTMGFQNCDLFFDKIYTDEIDQIRGFKYFNKFHSLSNITDVLNGTKAGRENQNERILIYNYGLAIFDLFFAKKIFDMEVGRDIQYNYCKEKYFV